MKIKAYLSKSEDNCITLVINGCKIEDIDIEDAVFEYRRYNNVIDEIRKCCIRGNKEIRDIWGRMETFLQKIKEMDEDDDIEQEDEKPNSDEGEKISIQEFLNKIKDPMQRQQIEQILQKYNDTYGHDIEFLGKGGSATVFSIGDKVIKFGSPPRINDVPMTLESEENIEYDDRYVMRIFQKLEIGDITRSDLQLMYNQLRKLGYVWNDIKDDNVGWLKKGNKREKRIIDDVDIWTEEEILSDKYRSVLEYVRSDVALFEIEYQMTHNPKFDYKHLGKYFRNYDYKKSTRIYVSELYLAYEEMKAREVQTQSTLPAQRSTNDMLTEEGVVSLTGLGEKSYKHFGSRIAERLKETINALRSRFFSKDKGKEDITNGR